MKKIFAATAAFALLVLGFTTSSYAHRNSTPKDLVQLACSTETRLVFGGFSTTCPVDPELPEPCIFGAPCSLCLHALLKKRCELSGNPVPVIFDAGDSGFAAFLYSLRGDCIETLIGGTENCSGPPSPSDKRLKDNIQLIGQSPNGINIYSWNYKNPKKYGQGIYSGVIAQEVPWATVNVGEYLYVDYSKVDVNFTKIN